MEVLHGSTMKINIPFFIRIKKQEGHLPLAPKNRPGGLGYLCMVIKCYYKPYIPPIQVYEMAIDTISQREPWMEHDGQMSPGFFNIAMPISIDNLPLKHGDFGQLCQITRGYLCSEPIIFESQLGETTPAVWTEADGSKKFLKSLAGKKTIGSQQSCHMVSLNLLNRWVRVHMLSNEQC